MRDTRSTTQQTRRQFLTSMTATGAFLPVWLSSSAAAWGAAVTSPNARPRVACIGNGGMGRGDASNAKRYGDLVAFCDVDRSHAERMRQEVGDGRGEICDDYRRVLERDDIDVVTISTPDHWHTKIAAEAMLAGKDIYCQKPLTLTIDEGKILCRVTRKTGRVLQVGSQQRSENRNRFLTAIAMVQDGRIGKVRRVTCILGTAPSGGPFEKTPPPAGLDWDRWLGPAPKVDYIRQRSHGTFRWWYEYSGGKLTDWGAHHVDIGQWAIGMDGSGPQTVEVLEGVHPVPYKNGYATVDDCYNTATNFRIRCVFPNGTEMIICNQDKNLDWNNGLCFEGEKGRFFVSRGEMRGEAVDALADQPIPRSTLVELRKGKPLGSHMGNFFACVADRGLPVSDVFSHHRTLTTCHLANIALRLNRKLNWDAKTEQIVGDTEANGFVSRTPRKGYAIDLS